MHVQFEVIWSTCYSRCILPVSPALSCPALMSLLNIIIWVYILVCMFLFLPRVCTVTQALSKIHLYQKQKILNGVWLIFYKSTFNNGHSHITLQPKTGCPLKLSRVEAGKYLDGRPPGKTRLLLEEVLVRGGCSPCSLCGSKRPSIVTGTLYWQKALSFGWDVKLKSWLAVVIKNPMALLVKSKGVTPVSWPNSLHWPLSIMAS